MMFPLGMKIIWMLVVETGGEKAAGVAKVLPCLLCELVTTYCVSMRCENIGNRNVSGETTTCIKGGYGEFSTIARKRGDRLVFEGINKKCQQCLEECKQWKQLIVVACPYCKGLPKRRAQKACDLPLGGKSQNGPRKEDI